ncbi:MAG TPA: spirocyclase AveC family protein [Nevskiaceae bacterium]|nr:spirocyclase AveC family protein [Nevskiaceae bacterium]
MATIGPDVKAGLAAARHERAVPLQLTAPRPVIGWATIGALCLLLEAYVMIAWILSPDFAPSPRGTDPIPALTLFWVRFFEGLSLVAVPVALWWAWRSSRREGRLSLDAIIILAWATLFWQDPMINWARPAFFYNAYFVNMGNWTNQIPGWVNPTSHLLPEPLLWMGGMYVWLPPIICGMTVAVMRFAKRQVPSLGTIGLIATGIAFCMLLDLVLEVLWVRSGVYAYPAAIGAFSLSAGELWQFPVYESIFWGPMWALTGLLFYFRDDRGHTLVDRGIDRVKAVRFHSAIRLLALIGALNVGFAVYNVFILWTTFQVDPTPSGYPSWLRAGQCGEGTPYRCAGPDVPVVIVPRDR